MYKLILMKHQATFIIRIQTPVTIIKTQAPFHNHILTLTLLITEKWGIQKQSINDKFTTYSIQSRDRPLLNKDL